MIQHVREGESDRSLGHIISKNFWFNSQHVRATGASEKVRVIEQTKRCVGIATNIQITFNTRHVHPVGACILCNRNGCDNRCRGWSAGGNFSWRHCRCNNRCRSCDGNRWVGRYGWSDRFFCTTTSKQQNAQTKQTNIYPPTFQFHGCLLHRASTLY